ncbi:hypothetical protein [Carboxydothermus pertinax]|uniref:hypothetical protein n=1 Tax=Carboxydothermus pertinax TaxID=870242 RepID=UPI000B544CB5|nr:hypothetical protein [Carboxydothermus pertinax]
MSLVSYIRQPRETMQKLLLYPGNKKVQINYLKASLFLVIGLMFFPLPETADFFYQNLSFTHPATVLTLLGVFLLFFALLGGINHLVAYLTTYFLERNLTKIEPELLFKRFLLGYSELLLFSAVPQAFSWLNLFNLGFLFGALTWATQLYALYLAYLMITTALKLFR